MTDHPICPDCHQPVINPGGHAERCHGPVQTPRELAEIIVGGNAFTDEDAVRVARAFLEATT